MLQSFTLNLHSFRSCPRCDALEVNQTHHWCLVTHGPVWAQNKEIMITLDQTSKERKKIIYNVDERKKDCFLEYERGPYKMIRKRQTIKKKNGQRCPLRSKSQCPLNTKWYSSLEDIRKIRSTQRWAITCCLTRLAKANDNTCSWQRSREKTNSHMSMEMGITTFSLERYMAPSPNTLNSAYPLT